jgi:hypothetical protein
MLPGMATQATPAGRTAVGLEMAGKRTFAWAPDWPGWCRSGRDAGQALEALAAVAPRYAVVAESAGVPLPDRAAEALEVVERVPGSATTDFGAPGTVAPSDRRPLTKSEAERQAALLTASWQAFDGVVAGAPAELLKGPRGGGRDRDKIVEHVLDAEVAYARKLGVRLRQTVAGDVEARSAHRRAILEALSGESSGEDAVERGWPPRYAARRIAWHVLEHTWEIEDRSSLD